MYSLIGANDAKEDFVNFLEKYGLYICLGVVTLIILTLIILFVIKPKRDNKNKVVDNSNEIISLLGGKVNIVSINQVGSRINLELVDDSLLDLEGLKQYGITNTIKMSSKIILVCNEASKINDLLQKNLQKQD
jgi:phosphotransferase system IIB component